MTAMDIKSHSTSLPGIHYDPTDSEADVEDEDYADSVRDCDNSLSFLELVEQLYHLMTVQQLKMEERELQQTLEYKGCHIPAPSSH